ncbi:MAG TPA: UrcA family protein [Sphingomicrobium sp.]|jgi:UrcA family protein|nr:UrcA family protein [Sphingomicrobium sp.]
MQKALVALGAVAAASALLIPTVVFASPMSAFDDGEAVQATVSYADLNLASARGVTDLRHRIAYTAKSVCGDPFARRIVDNRARRVCVDGAVASAQPAFEAAVAAARNPTVTVTYGASLIVTAPR